MPDLPTNESDEIRLKRLRIRSWRRGTKEMDLILGPFSDAPDGLAALDQKLMAAYEVLLDENDNDLYLWVSGAQPMPQVHRGIIEELQRFHQIET